MNIENIFGWKINYSAVQIALLLKVKKLYKKVWQKKQIFLVSILFKKVREEKGRVGVVIRAWPYIREKYSE